MDRYTLLSHRIDKGACLVFGFMVGGFCGSLLADTSRYFVTNSEAVVGANLCEIHNLYPKQYARDGLNLKITCSDPITKNDVIFTIKDTDPLAKVYKENHDPR